MAIKNFRSSIRGIDVNISNHEMTPTNNGNESINISQNPAHNTTIDPKQAFRYMEPKRIQLKKIPHKFMSSKLSEQLEPRPELATKHNRRMPNKPGNHVVPNPKPVGSESLQMKPGSALKVIKKAKQPLAIKLRGNISKEPVVFKMQKFGAHKVRIGKSKPSPFLENSMSLNPEISFGLKLYDKDDWKFVQNRTVAGDDRALKPGRVRKVLKPKAQTEKLVQKIDFEAEEKQAVKGGSKTKRLKKKEVKKASTIKETITDRLELLATPRPRRKVSTNKFWVVSRAALEHQPSLRETLLSKPKNSIPGPYKNPFNVTPSALRAEPNRRIKQLAVPKTHFSNPEKNWGVSSSALTAKPTRYIKRLATPRSTCPITEKKNAFEVSSGAL